MKRTLVVSAVLVLLLTGVGSVACAQQPEGGSAAAPAAGQPSTAEPSAAADDTAAAAPTADQKVQASYGFGYQMGRNMHQQNVTFDLEALIDGLRAGVSGEDPKYTPEQMQGALTAVREDMMARQKAELAASAKQNLAAGAAFRQANAEKEGVEVFPSGVQFQVLTAGTGPSPDPGDKVVINYRGTLPDGTQFDSSYDRGQPATFPIKGVIPGFSEALQHMKKGGKYRVVIPPDQGYGEDGGGPIPPNATLIFEVELMDVVDAVAAPADEGAGEG